MVNSQESTDRSYKFRRQHSIDPYIVDFVCLERKLIIELDGGCHECVGERDLERQRYLETLGFRVVRFTNEDVLEDLNAMAVGIGRIVLGIR